MFWFRDSREGGVRADVAFTDASLDLRGLLPGFPAELARLEQACGVRFARLSQVHGREVVAVRAPHALDEVPSADALVTDAPGVGLMVRAADCVPVVLADVGAGVAAAVHAGRQGVVHDVVTAAVDSMLAHGAQAGSVQAWVGPHVCGGCYEVPAQMREEVAAVEPSTWATTTWGTPSVDVGAGVTAQLARAGVETTQVGGCTREEQRLPSYRRDGAASGRLAGLVWLS